MDKKDILEKLKSEKGITGADIAVAISIIVIMIVVITMIYINIDVGNKNVNRTAGATRLATNILENLKLEEYENVVSLDTENGDGNRFYNTKIPNGYKVKVIVNEFNSEDIFKLVKNVNIEVKYKVGDEEKNISLSTTITAESFEECNKPNFSEKFLVNSLDSETKELTGKIIVPIKYSYVNKKYVITNEEDKEWYNYSSKEWAKVLVFDDNETKDKFIDINNNIITEKVEIGDKEKVFTDFLYVWIPNFGKEVNKIVDEQEIEGKYYFRFGAKNTETDNSGNTISVKNAIVFSKVKELITDEELGTSIKLNSYTIDDNIEFKISGDNAIVMQDTGYWRLYNENPEIDTVYGQLNISQFGPLTLEL